MKKLATLEEQLEAIGQMENGRTPAENLYWKGVKRAKELGVLRKDKLV